jgi:hypothetical protein
MTNEPQEIRPADILQRSQTSLSVSRLAETIGRQVEPGGTPYAKVRLGYVTAFDPATWTCTALIGDLLTPVPGIAVLADVLPAIESAAMFAQTGGSSTTEYILIGMLPKDAGTATYGKTWRIRKSADQGVLNSSTAVADTELNFRGQAGRNYLVDAFVIITKTGTEQLSKFKLGWILPSGATWSGGAIGPIQTLAASLDSSQSTGAGVNWRAHVNDTGTFPYGIDVRTDTGVESYGVLVNWKGSVKMGATSGTCSIAWAQQVAGGGGITTRVKEGSTLAVDMTTEYTL